LNDKVILQHLEELARRLDIKVRYEIFDPEGPFLAHGLCRLRGENLLIIDSRVSLEEKIRNFAEALNTFDLDAVYLKPFLREFLAGFHRE